MQGQGLSQADPLQCGQGVGISFAERLEYSIAFPFSALLALRPASALRVSASGLSFGRRRDASEHRGGVDWFSAVGAVHRVRESANARIYGSGSMWTYSVKPSFFFDDIVSEFVGVSGADTGAARVVLLADHSKRFSAIGAGFAVVRESNTNALHCAAIAEAMPGYVLLRSFHLSGLGASLFCPLAHWFSHRPLDGFCSTFVGTRAGRFFSHKQVVLDSGCPNCHGWMMQSGFLILVEIAPTGFSSAICLQSAPSRQRTKSSASSVSFGSRRPRTVQCIPDEQR